MDHEPKNAMEGSDTEIRAVPEVQEIPQLPSFSSEELREMPLTELVSHTVRLQQLYHQLYGDYHFLTWEFGDYQEYITFFPSR